MATLKDKVKAKEAEQKVSAVEKEPVSTEKKTTVKKIAGKKSKDKMISAAVNSTLYAQFTEVNKAYGMSNNSMINMLIAQYVQENKHLLDN